MHLINRIDKIGASLLGTAGLILFVSFMVNGYGCMSMVRTQVPTGMQAAIGSSHTVPLNEADGITNQWKTFVTTNTNQWETNLDQAWFVWGIISSLGNMGMESMQALSIGGIPIGGMLVTLLGFGGGYRLTNGRDRKLMSEREKIAEARGKELAEALFKEKIKSFNKGMERNGE